MPCKLCGSLKIKDKYLIERFKPAFKIVQCETCCFEFQSLSSEQASFYYDEAYYNGSAEYSYVDERKLEEASRFVWKRRVRKLKECDQSKAEKPAFLDIGCSFGGLLQTASEAGYTPYGVEISEYSGAYSRKRFGADKIMTGNIETLPLPRDSFSVVTMIEVIEHLADPAAALSNIYQSMRDGGVVLIQTADMAGMQAVLAGKNYHYYLPGHLSYFTRSNLEKALLKTGFSKTRFVGGVEFGLLPKLLKSRKSFKSWKDYRHWLRISFYHGLSKLVIGGLHMTSSMVMLAWK